MAYNLLQITKEDLKNLCFGCADCNFCIEVWVCKTRDETCLWLISDNLSVFMCEDDINILSSTTKSFMRRVENYTKITSYEELLNHYSDGGAWLKW